MTALLTVRCGAQVQGGPAGLLDPGQAPRDVALLDGPVRLQLLHLPARRLRDLHQVGVGPVAACMGRAPAVVRRALRVGLLGNFLDNCNN